MTQFAQDMRLIWRYAVFYPMLPRWRFISFSWLALSLPALIWLFFISKANNFAEGDLSVLQAFLLVPTLLILFQFWILLIHWSKRLNTLTSARLVPRIRERCLQAAILGMVFLTILSTAVVNRFYGHVGQSLVMSLVVLIVIASSTVRPVVGISIILIATVVLPHMSQYLPSWLTQYLWNDFLAWIAVPPLLALAFLMVSLNLHRGLDEKGAAGANRPVASSSRGGNKKIANLFSTCMFCDLYARSLKRSCEERDHAALMMLACGHGVDWRGLLLATIGLAGILGPVVVLFFRSADMLSDLLNSNRWLFLSVSILPLQWVATQALTSAIYQRQAEQGLYRLAPLAQGAASFNQVLAMKILRVGLRNWLFFSGLILVLTLATGAGLPGLLIQSALCCMSLPMLAKPFRNYAKVKSGKENDVLWFLLGWFLLGLFLIAAVMLAMVKTGLIALPICATAFAMFAFVLISRRLKRMSEAPVAFPSGRVEVAIL